MKDGSHNKDLKQESEKNNRTEQSRVKLFSGSNQTEWAKMSKKVELALCKMISSNATLLDMCNYAKDERNKIAHALGHEPAEDFGKIRDSAELFGDIYTP
ncbi:MAG TPA: hypothetical protein PLD88_07250, partial [Candidatus Berkiella sp.]|nr:hypothetical protein [Candidatus Berkiella sp.]